jgi:predicted phage terminase large subunit-like protein
VSEVKVEDLREEYRNNLKFLCTTQLGYKDWDLVHDDVWRMLLRPSRKKLVLIPRGHLKSAIITKGFAIQQMLKDPNVRILIAHEVWDKSREMLAEIKEYLTAKSQLPLIFGNFVSDRWNQDQIVVKQRTKAFSAPTIGTTGVESEMTSTHYDIIICDDLQGLQNVQTVEQRQKVRRFFNSLLDLLEPGGLLVVVGTRWHQDDLYAHIIENEADYFDIMVRRVIENGKLIFPKKFSQRFDPARKCWALSETQVMDYVDHLRKAKGSDFFAQYMNNPIDEDSQMFKPSYFKYWDRRPANMFTAMPGDLAISLKQEADYTAFVVTGMDPDWNIYILDYVRGHWTPAQIVDNLFQMHMKWKPNATGLEVNGFQRTLKYAAEDEMRRRRYHFPIEEIRTSNQVSKEYRIKALEPYYRDGKVFHATWMKGKDLETELLTFPKGRNDDLIDALSMSLQLLVPGTEHTTQEVPEGSWESAQQQARKMMTPYRSFYEHG